MKNYLISLRKGICACCVFIASLLVVSQAYGEGFDVLSDKNNAEKHALIILNSEYNSPMPAVADVDANGDGIAYLTKSLGYPAENTVTLENPSMKEIKGAVSLISGKLSPTSQVMVYYNGNSINRLENNQNVLLMSGLKLPSSTDVFLWERRLKRASISLNDIVGGFAADAAQQVTVIYDACTQTGFPNEEGAAHWSIVSQTPCSIESIDGANVFYGNADIPTDALVEGFIIALSENANADLVTLDKAVVEALKTEFDLETLEGPLLSTGGVRNGFEAAQICLGQTDDGCANSAGDQVVEVAEPEVKPADTEVATSEEPKTAVDGSVLPRAKGLTLEMTEEEKQELADFQEMEEKRKNEVVVESTTTAADVEAKKAAMASKVAMRNDWNAAKESNACSSYQAFLDAYPKSFHRKKAVKALEGGCEGNQVAATEPTPEEPKKEEVAKVEEPKPEPKKEEKVVDAPKAEEPKVEEPKVVEAPKEVEVAVAEKPKKASRREVLLAWADTKKSNKCSDYQAFITKYESALQNVMAKQRLKNGKCLKAEAPAERIVKAVQPEPKVIKEEPKPEVVVAEPKPEPKKEVEVAKGDKPKLTSSEAWNIAKAENTCVGYLQFREDYPSTIQSFRAKTSSLRVCSSKERTAFAKTLEEKTKQKLAAVKEEKTEKTVVAVMPKVEEPKVEEAVVKQPSKTVKKAPKVVVPIKSKTLERFEDPNRYALILINQTYDETLGPVAAGAADQEAILKVVEELQIPKENVKVLIDPTKNELEEEAFAFALDMKPRAQLLFYYSGHSITYQEENTNHIIPSDFVIPTTKQTTLAKRRFRSNTIPLSFVVKLLTENNPQQLAVVYNGCGTQAMPNNDEPYWEFLLQRTCSNQKLVGASAFYPVKDGQIATASFGKDDTDPRSLFMRGFADSIIKNPAVDFKDLNVQTLWSIASEARRLKKHDFLQEPVLLNNPEVAAEKVGYRCFSKVEVDGEGVCSNLEGNSISKTEPIVDEIKVPEEDEVKISPTTGAMIQDWDTAKAADSCEAYAEFKSKHPNSVYSYRADAVIKDRDCGAEKQIVEEPTPVGTEFCEPPNNSFPEGKLNKTGVRGLQTELNRLGCSAGRADGAWGGGSQRGLNNYIKYAKVTPNSKQPSCQMLDELKAIPDGRVCPIVCSSNQDLIGGKCVTRKVAPKPVAATPKAVETKPAVTTVTPKVETKPKITITINKKKEKCTNKLKCPGALGGLR